MRPEHNKYMCLITVFLGRVYQLLVQPKPAFLVNLD